MRGVHTPHFHQERFLCSHFLKELQISMVAKKKPSLNGQAIKSGGGGKGSPLRVKRTFFLLFFILLPFKSTNYFITYQNIDISR